MSNFKEKYDTYKYLAAVILDSFHKTAKHELAREPTDVELINIALYMSRSSGLQDEVAYATQEVCGADAIKEYPNDKIVYSLCIEDIKGVAEDAGLELTDEDMPGIIKGIENGMDWSATIAAVLETLDNYEHRVKFGV